MVKDRHRLNRLKKGKDANEKQYQALFEQSHLKVLERIERIPNIKLNQDLPVTPVSYTHLTLPTSDLV